MSKRLEEIKKRDSLYHTDMLWVIEQLEEAIKMAEYYASFDVQRHREIKPEDNILDALLIMNIYLDNKAREFLEGLEK